MAYWPVPVLADEPVPVPVPVADDEAFDELDDEPVPVADVEDFELDDDDVEPLEVEPVPPAPPVLVESPQPAATPKRPRSTVAKPRTLITLITPPFAPYDARPVWRMSSAPCKSSTAPSPSFRAER